MALTKPTICQQEGLARLPDELLLMICRNNMPPPGSSKEAIQSYFHSHSLTQHIRDCAEDAFKEDFTLEVDLDVQCHDSRRSRWHVPFLSPDWVDQDVGFKKLIRKVDLKVRCLHNKFFRETIEETMRLVRMLSRETDMKEIEVVIESHDTEFADDFTAFISWAISTELPRLTIPGRDERVQAGTWELDVNDEAPSGDAEMVDWDDFVSDASSEPDEQISRPAGKIDTWKTINPIELGRDCPWNEDAERQCEHCKKMWWWCDEDRTWKLKDEEDEDEEMQDADMLTN
ncbi:hypothetical protein PRZ48_009007 [Zasmidium cellare]|uniref:Uncharacterized protein n=1 Tax=Zasmidium cellare TaxID=395010 RepID=A0ABR0EHR7_ZASCE|nr:hypothetical protein PRZ48_009007 [Zasmidium cellare]